MTNTTGVAAPSRLLRALNTIERVGNKLPDPVSLFIISILFVMVLSALIAGTTAVNPATGAEVTAISLLDAAQIRKLFVELPQTLTSFPPLGGDHRIRPCRARRFFRGGAEGARARGA
jgi:p-aminobenzoyl-glutamate transporter AbgT